MITKKGVKKMFFATGYNYNTNKWCFEKISKMSYDVYMHYLDGKSEHDFVYFGF